MDNEISTSIMLAIELMVLSVVIGIVMVFVGLGQGFQRNAVSDVSDVVAYSYGSEILALEESGELIPVASVYLAIERNEDIIDSVSGKINNYNIYRKEDLKSFFYTKVKVDIEETANKLYKIKVEG